MAARLKQRHTALCEVMVRTHVEAEEAVSEILLELFGIPSSSFREPESELVETSLFLPWEQRPQQSGRHRLQTQLAWLARCGLQTGPAQIHIRRLANRNWKESWKRHFKSKVIGGRLLLKPSWSQRKPTPGQVAVVLDPGLSFGTGQHPTTTFCLRELVRARRRGVDQSFLDVGTGSGILAIAAAKLGYRNIQAFDLDPEAVRVATRNACRNRVTQNIKLRRADLSALPVPKRARYDVVCANLLAPLLIAECARLCGFVRPGGLLVIAGILAREFASVNAAFSPLTASLIRDQVQGEWQSAAYQILS